MQDDCRVVLAKQEISCLLETLQKQQHQFTELADHIQLDAGIPVTFTKVFVCVWKPLPRGDKPKAKLKRVFRTTEFTSDQRWRSGW